MSKVMFSIQSAANQFLSNLSSLEHRISTSNAQVSSGLRVQTVSDDPADVTEITQLTAQIAANSQIGTNLGAVQTELNAAEGAINTATGIMDSAAQIAAEATTNGSTTNPSQLALQVNQLMIEMQQLANSQVGGRYVFSGDSDQTAPYGAVNLTTNPTNGVGTYLGSASTRTVEDSYGVAISISGTAQTIFDGGTAGTVTTSAFQALASLYSALNSNSVTAAETAESNIQSASNYLDGQQAIYGDMQNKVSDALTAQASFDTNLRSQMSNLQDADAPQAIVQMQTDNTALTAAEAAYSSIPKKSLFDYLA